MASLSLTNLLLATLVCWSHQGLLGGWQVADLSQQNVQKAAHFAVDRISQGLNTPFALKLLAVKSASIQVVAGVNFQLTFVGGLTSCKKGTEFKLESCQLNQGLAKDQGYKCKVKVFTALNGSSELSEFKCEDVKVSEVTKQSPAENAGGWSVADTNDDAVQQAAKFSIRRISEGINSIYTLKPIKVVKASKQVVAGMNYRIAITAAFTTCRKSEQIDLSKCDWNRELGESALKCTVQVYRDLKNVYHLNHQQCTTAKLDSLLGKPPSNDANIPGGWSEVDTKDAAVQQAAHFSIHRISEGVNSMYSLRTIKVESASQQVVAGMNYRMTVTAAFTTCRKSEKLDLSKCGWNQELKDSAFRCTVQVYRDLKNAYQLTKQQCTAAKLDSLIGKTADSAPVMVGGWQNVNASDEDVQKMAQVAVASVSATLNTDKRLKLARVVKAAVQIVAGKKYSLVVDFGKTNCLKTSVEQKALKSCRLTNTTHVTRCNIEVLSVPWEKRIEVGKPENCKIVKVTELITDTKLQQHKALFQKFKKQYDKEYGTSEEEEKRFQIFIKNQGIIEGLRKSEQGTAKYGNTIFADLTREEFTSQRLGFKPSLADKTELKRAKVTNESAIPSEFDWRKKNAVTEVKNQGTCGSCWAFSTTGNIEGQWAIKKKSLISLSEQELVDCDKVDQGCNGGLPSNAYKQIIKIGGLETEIQYPYEGEREKCSFAKSKSRVYINSSVAVSTNETQMAQWLVQNGPISIGINAMAMQFYFGGVSHPWKIFCNPATLDHGVLIVGYGVETTSILHRKLPFWIVKNSWGASWGESGYYRVYRGDGTCGLNRMPTSAVIN